MGDTPLQRVQAGDPFSFSAQTFNIFCETAEEVARWKRELAAGGIPSRFAGGGVATVRNDTGYDLVRFAVVGIGDPIIDASENLAEFKNRVTFKGEMPTVAAHAGRFGILLEPIGNSRLGKALVSGVRQVQLIVNDAADTHADVTHNDPTALTTGPKGAEILWKESGTGSGKWGIVRVGAKPPASKARWIRFALSEGLLYTDASADAEVLAYWDGDDPDPEDAGVSVYSLPIPGNIYLFRGDSGACGLACYDPEQDRYHIVQLQCP